VSITVRKALEDATSRLSAVSAAPKANLSRTARLDAEVLLRHVLGWDLSALLAHPERTLSQEELANYESLVLRRMAHEPVQHITGEQEFFGLAMKVTPDVLIPRPETEHLVEAVLERVDQDLPLRIVDIGTGSGAIAIALAVHLPNAELTAVDISPDALEVARQNAGRHGVAGRIRFLHGDLLSGLGAEVFDVVVSNPPYIAESETLEPQVRDFEPRLALYAGPTGIEVYERLIPQAHAALKPGGWLMLEIGYGQEPSLENLLREWQGVSFLPDLQEIPRVALARRRRDA
jgi:release factor glutamine methyltransferase